MRVSSYFLLRSDKKNPKSHNSLTNSSSPLLSSSMSLLPLLSLSLLLLCIQTYSSSTCKSFNCGDLTIKYPFSLYDNATNNCGLPGFLISCENNTPILHLQSDNYTVLSIEYDNNTITLVDTDVLEQDGTCPRVQHNVSFFANSGVTYTSSDVNLMFFFGCNLTDAQNYSPITCFTGAENGNSYVFIADPLHPFQYAEFMTGCLLTVVVPVLNYSVGEYHNDLSTAFGQVLKKGFQLGWTQSDNCTECKKRGGQCGYTLLADNYTYNFTCFCGNGSCDKKSHIGVIIGISVTAVVATFLLFSVFCFLYMRKKRQHSSRSMLLKQSRSIPSLEQSSMHSRDLSDVESIQFTHIFPYQELEEATNGFDSKEEVGDGGFGTVYKGKLHDGRIVAIKRLYEHNCRRMEQFMNEVQILSRLRHPNLVALYGCTSRHSRELLLVYEYIPNGTVADHLHGSRANEHALTWYRRLAIAIETADALAYLHAVDPPIVHRDIKTTNMLVDAGYHVKVADFGLSRLFPTAVTHVSTAPQGTPGYVDPEYHKCYQLTDKSDVYSFGVVLVELISSMPAVDVTRHRDEINLSSMAIKKIQQGKLDMLVDPSLGFGSDAATRRMITMVAELAFRCLQPDGDMRPPIREVLEVLLEIQKEGKNLETANGALEKEDRTEDHRGLLKNSTVPPSSPDSVIAKWNSRSTTPNASE